MALSPQEFADRLVTLRQNRLLDVRDAAKIAGVSSRQWSRWENAQINAPQVSTLRKLLERFELDPSYFGLDNNVRTDVLQAINAKLDAILEHLGITAPAAAEVPGPPPGALAEALQDEKPSRKSPARKGSRRRSA